MSVTYIGPKSSLAHVTWLGHHFQGEKVEGQSQQAALLTVALMRQAAAAVSVGTYWLCETTATLRACCAARGALAPTEWGEGRGHIVVAARLQLVLSKSNISG